MPAPNLARAAFSQGSQILRVRRTTGAYVGGVWTTSFDHDELIRAAVRPNAASPQASAISTRLLLPEGTRIEDTITVLVMPGNRLYTEASIEDGAASPDRILYAGWWWKVVGETQWDQVGFRRYFAVREQKWSAS